MLISGSPIENRAVVLAMRADRAIRPAQRFQERARLPIVVVFLSERDEVQFFRIQSFSFHQRGENRVSLNREGLGSILHETVRFSFVVPPFHAW